MNILHYSLGFPPYRTGGLTKFCVDLMTQQAADGHTVSLLWPGEILVFFEKTFIKQHRKKNGISSFEVINPTPVSYDEGILEIEEFTKEGTLSVYLDFLKKLAPDVIHVHTLMGLHRSFLVAAKNLGIRLVFSTHDFFPICPKVTMFREGSSCKNVRSCESCAECNLTALSLNQITILQSGIYRIAKDSPLVKKLRKQHRDSYLSGETSKKLHPAHRERTAADYQHLRAFYKNLLELMDVIHYNSSVTRDIYNTYFQLTGPNDVLIPISHAHIQDCKRVKQFGDNLRITYLGPASAAKGFFLLKDALDILWNDPQSGRQDFCLNVFFSPTEKPPYMKTHGRYHHGDLADIFDHTDILIAPSIWHETFGYTVLEALSYGVPVLISDSVGAKDIIPDGGGIVIPDITSEKLAEALRHIHAEQLQKMNTVIINQMNVPSLISMSNAITSCYCDGSIHSYAEPNKPEGNASLGGEL